MNPKTPHLKARRTSWLSRSLNSELWSTNAKAPNPQTCFSKATMHNKSNEPRHSPWVKLLQQARRSARSQRDSLEGVVCLIPHVFRGSEACGTPKPQANALKAQAVPAAGGAARASYSASEGRDRPAWSGYGVWGLPFFGVASLVLLAFASLLASRGLLACSFADAPLSACGALAPILGLSNSAPSRL